MPTEKKIKTSYLKIHDSLSEDYYQNRLMSKEDFDYYHGQNWEDMGAELITRGYRTIPEPPRDLAAEITAQKAEIDKLKADTKELVSIIVVPPVTFAL